MATVFAGMLRFAARVGGHLFEPGVGSVHWRDGRAALLHGWDVARSGTWKVAFVTPPTVWGRLSAHEDAAMKRVQGLLTPRAVYLCTLGVEPEQAGRGHGGRLLQQALSGFAGRWDTCVLRTEQPRNLPFYARNGFELRDELVIPQSGLRTWFFSRAV